jgi:hypothetical protein
MNAQNRGQAIVLVALAIAALVGMFLLVVNGGMFLLSRLALERTVDDAAVAGLRTGTAGGPVINAGQAETEARQVLTLELANVKGLQEDPTVLANAATVNVSDLPAPGSCVAAGGECHPGSLVEVQLTATLCPPVWPTCFAVPVSRQAVLAATSQLPVVNTPIPGDILPLTPIP